MCVILVVSLLVPFHSPVFRLREAAMHLRGSQSNEEILRAQLASAHAIVDRLCRAHFVLVVFI